MKIEEIVEHSRIVCPICKNNNFKVEARKNRVLFCCNCNIAFNLINDVPLLIPPSSSLATTKEQIQEFWGELFDAAYGGCENICNKHNYVDQFKKLKKLFQDRQHLAVTEMPISDLEGRGVLEIGSGAGAHSALFSIHGAHMTSLDLTIDRVVETSRKLHVVGGEEKCFALQGDAEILPFPNDHFDIVYSNGVLHHTPDTAKTIKEVYRVLKPGGQAVIMLYAKHSFLYWVNLFFIKGILLGNIFRHPKSWLGRTTEWMSVKTQTIYNPETKVYSKDDINKLFMDFDELNIRKNSFVFQQIPLIGRGISFLIGKFSGYNDAGYLIYNEPWRNESKLELWLGQFMGFCLNIRAIKK